MEGAVETRLGKIGVLADGLGQRASERLPILFLHGVGSDKSAWAPQVAHFSRTRAAIAADYPGYGDSAFTVDATRDDYADAMIALLDALEIERAHLCGLSLGGVIALAMAAAAPDRVASLVIANSFALHPDGRAIHDGSVAACGEMGMAAMADARIDRLLGSHPPQGLRADAVRTMSAIRPEAYRLGARAVWLADMRTAAADIKHPALVLCGSEDRVTPPALSDDLAERLGDARRIDIEGASHLSNLERPESFNSAVDEFISELDQ